MIFPVYGGDLSWQNRGQISWTVFASKKQDKTSGPFNAAGRIL